MGKSVNVALVMADLKFEAYLAKLAEEKNRQNEEAKKQMSNALTVLLWVLTLLFCFMIIVSLYNYQTLFGLHWLVIGFQVSNAMSQFHLHDWPVLIAEIFPAVVAAIGMVIVLYKSEQKKREVQYECQR